MRHLVHPALSTALGPFRRYVPAVVLLGLASTALEGTGIALMIPLLDALLSEAPGGADWPAWAPLGGALSDGPMGMVLALAILALVAAKNLVVWGNGVLQGWIYGRAGHHLRDLLAWRLLRMDAAFRLGQSPSRLVNIIAEESWRVADGAGSLLAMLVSLAAVAMFLAFLLVVSPLLTVVVLLGLAAVQLLGALASWRFGRLGREVTTRNQALAARMFHLVGAWRLIRLFHQEEREVARFSRASDELRRAALNLQRRQVGVGPVMEVAQTSLFVLVVLVAAWRGLSFGLVATFIFLLYRLEPQVRRFQAALADLQGRSGSLDEVLWLLEAPGDRAPARPAAPAPPLRSGIRFEDVSYHYGVAPALSHVSFEIPAGTSLALIGRSGSGKSTVANLLCGLTRPSEGRILVDGTPLEAIDRASWFGQVAIVSQELELFEGSLADNIRYGAPDAPLEAVVEAARAADADGFIRALPEGYETAVGSRGITLSAGQRQRIALARALLGDPRLLILDEATNALDLSSEAAVMRTIERRLGRATTVVISHHASSIRLCDAFLRLDRGVVVEAGTTQGLDGKGLGELLAHPGPA